MKATSVQKFVSYTGKPNPYKVRRTGGGMDTGVKAAGGDNTVKHVSRKSLSAMSRSRMRGN